MNEEIGKEHVEAFLSNTGKRGVAVLNALGKLAPIKKALDSDIGRIIIGDIIVEMEVILPKIINEKATPIELADFRAGRRLAEKVAARINAYELEKSKVLSGSLK